MLGVGKVQRREQKIFRVLKELTNKYPPRTDAINDENVVTLEDEDIKCGWKEYSTKLYEVKDHQQTYNRSRTQDEPPPLRSEVEKTLQQIRQMGSHLEQMTFLLNSEEGVELLWQLCTKIW